MQRTTEQAAELVHPENPERAGTPPKVFIQRHAVPIYYALVFAISWGGVLLALGADGWFSTGATMTVAGGAALITGPSVAGVAMTGLVDGRAGLRQLVSRLRRWRVAARWYAVALLTGPLVMGGTLFGLSLVSSEFRPNIRTTGETLGIVVFGLALGLAVGVFEELGWTGFALPMLRRRYGVFITGLLMGVLWGAWHFPMFAGSTDPSGTVPRAVVVAAFLFAWLPGYRVLMVWVYDRTESLLVAMLMHAPISATTYILASILAEARSATAILAPVLTWGAAFWLIVAVLAWVNGGHRTQRQNVATQESPTTSTSRPSPASSGTAVTGTAAGSCRPTDGSASGRAGTTRAEPSAARAAGVTPDPGVAHLGCADEVVQRHPVGLRQGQQQFQGRPPRSGFRA